MSECPSIACCDPDDFEYSITSGRVYENAESSFVVQCPEGHICAPGQYPKTVIIPAGSITFQPDVKPDADYAQTLYLECCSGTITSVIPIGSTQAQIDAIIAQMLADWAQAEAACKGTGGAPEQKTYFNNDICMDYCPDPGCTVEINFEGMWSPPPGTIFLETQICVPSGMFSASTLAEANYLATDYLIGILANCVVHGVVTCTCCDLPRCDHPEEVIEDNVVKAVVGGTTYWLTSYHQSGCYWHSGSSGNGVGEVKLWYSGGVWHFRVTLPTTTIYPATIVNGESGECVPNFPEGFPELYPFFPVTVFNYYYAELTTDATVPCGTYTPVSYNGTDICGNVVEIYTGVSVEITAEPAP